MSCDRELLNYELAHKALGHLTVTRAARFLTYIFDCGSHEIYTNLGYSTTPINLATEPSLSGCLAGQTRIWFWGGPPGCEDWYYGSLLTLLIDKLFYCVTMNFEDVVAKFLEALNGSETSPHYETRQIGPATASCA